MSDRDDPPKSPDPGASERRRARAAEALRANLRRRKAPRKPGAPDDEHKD
jgi:hypothetical protein